MGLRHLNRNLILEEIVRQFSILNRNQMRRNPYFFDIKFRFSIAKTMDISTIPLSKSMKLYRYRELTHTMAIKSIPKDHKQDMRTIWDQINPYRFSKKSEKIPMSNN